MKKTILSFLALTFLATGCGGCTTVNVKKRDYINNLTIAHNTGCTVGLWEMADYCEGEGDPDCQEDIRVRCKRLSDQYQKYLERELFK